MTSKGLSRRSFLRGVGGVAGAGLAACAAPEGAGGGAEVSGTGTLSGKLALDLQVNGETRRVEVEPRTTLLNALRNHADPPLTGTKLVCDAGNCGACTVLLDGQPAYSCLTLAVSAAGRAIRTVEGLAVGGALSPLQEEFCRHDALMCGFCTPGFLMSLTACLERTPGASPEEIRSACAGNLCRCGTYPHIFEAALEAGRRLRGGA